MRSLPKLQRVGFIAKTHGFRGQLKLVLETEITHSEWDWLFVEIDKKPVPFFVESIADKGGAFLVKLKGLNNEQEAASLCGNPFSLPTDLLPEEQPFLELENFQIRSSEGEYLGKVLEVIPGHMQDILLADINGQEVMIPWHENFIIDILESKGHIIVFLPEELRHLNS